MSKDSVFGRRQFLRTVAASTAAMRLAGAPDAQNPYGRKIKAALIGCGNLANGSYLPHLTKSPFVEIVSLCDIIPTRAQNTAKRFNIAKWYPNVKEQLAGESFELLINTTSMPSHFPVNKAGLEAGKHVWSEKPMATAVPDAKILVELARKKGVHLWPSPDCVTSPQFKFMSETIQSGKIGKVFNAHAVYGHQGELWSPWFFQKGGGSLYDLGVYNVTTLTGLLGPATNVVAMWGVAKPVRTVHPPDGPPIDVKVEADDNLHLIMEHDHAVYSHVQTGYTYVSGDDDKDTSHTQYTVDIIGTGGELHLVGYDWAPHGVDMNTKEHPKYERYAVDPGTYLWEGGGSYVAECLLSGKPSLITPEHGLHVLEVMNAALESGTTGRRVKVESTFKWPLFAA